VMPTEGTVTKRPSDCTVAERERFATLVTAGGQVYVAGLRDRIAGADHLAFQYLGGEVVGVAGLKNLPLWYRDDIFRKAASSLPAVEFPLELGWVYVESTHRGSGASARLVQALIEAARDRNVYAIAHANNYRMHRSLERHGFVREGHLHASAIEAGQMVQLFVRWGTSRSA
jgi:RimJ/RimL family protein N-acetyltransferase